MRDPTDISNWHRIDARITSSGQPQAAQLAALQAIGVRHVVNLALHSHERAIPDEAPCVEALGMTYTHIPVVFDAPTEEDFARFCDAMQGFGADKVHVHCIVNARVSAFLYRYRRDVLGVPETVARADLDRIWRPGGVWAAFIGDDAAVALPHRLPG